MAFCEPLSSRYLRRSRHGLATDGPGIGDNEAVWPVRCENTGSQALRNDELEALCC